MTRYRKKPIVIDAFKWTGGPDLTGDMVGPEWIIDAIQRGDVCLFKEPVGNMFLRINTLEGTMEAHPGDWIIKGIKGEIYPCKDDIFRATYEKVN